MSELRKLQPRLSKNDKPVLINDGEWHPYQDNWYDKVFLEVKLVSGEILKGWPNAGKIRDFENRTDRIGYFAPPSNITHYRVLFLDEC